MLFLQSATNCGSVYGFAKWHQTVLRGLTFTANKPPEFTESLSLPHLRFLQAFLNSLHFAKVMVIKKKKRSSLKAHNWVIDIRAENTRSLYGNVDTKNAEMCNIKLILSRFECAFEIM